MFCSQPLHGSVKKLAPPRIQAAEPVASTASAGGAMLGDMPWS